MKTRSFESHGVSFKTKPGAKDATAICPFCQSIHNGGQKEGKFSVEIETGVWQCWHCKRKGNIQTFLEQIHEHWLTQTSEVEYEALAAARPGLHIEDFQLQKLAYNQLTDRWLLPCYTRRNTLANLYTYQPGAHAFCTAGMGHGLFGMESIQAGKPIYMVEGPWSRMAMLRLMKAAKIKGSVVGVPGSVFKQDWCDLFIGQTLYLTFDNDSAGGEETERAMQFLTSHPNGKPKAINRIHWPSTAPPKWDPREMIHFELDTSGHKPASVWTDFNRLFTPATYSVADVEEPEQEEPLPTVKSFKVLTKHFRDNGLHLNDNMIDGIAVMLAIAVSAQLPGSPLWAFIVGAPGCLSGDTPLVYQRNKQKRNLSIEELFWSLKGSPGAEFTIPYMDENRQLRSCVIRDVLYSGRKPVFRLTTEDGQTLRATKDHRFLTPKGWKRLENLVIGDCVFVPATREASEPKKRVQSKWVRGLRYHPNATRQHAILPKNRWAVRIHRLLLEAAANGLEYSQYIHILKKDPERAKTLVYIPKTIYVHHADEDPENNEESNLSTCTPSDHATVHRRETNALINMAPSRVVGIKPDGESPTFDLCVDEPHNFLANGIIVHNSGKTLTLEAFSRYQSAVYRSSIRATELISGWMTEDGSDPSLIPKIQGKTLVLKDYTEIMAMNQQDQEILYGVLRGAYDGRAERYFANGLERVYTHCWFNLIAGVTDDIKAHNRASLGERFIRFQWVESEGYDRTAHITAAIRGLAKQSETERLLAGYVAGFLSTFDMSEIKLPTIEPWFETRIVALVQILAHLRARISTEHHGELTHRPTIEIGTRPAVQFCKLSQCLCVILGKKRIDMDIYNLIEKLFRDTSEGWSYDIFNCLLQHDPEPVTKEFIERDARIPSSTCFRRLEAMEALGTITRDRIAAIVPGRPAYGWRLSDSVRELVTQAKLGTTEPHQPEPKSTEPLKRIRQPKPTKRKG